MENNELDKIIRRNLKYKEEAPDYINKKLIRNSKSNNEFKGFILIFFLISIIQSLFIISIGIFLVSNMIMKIFIIEFGITLLLTSIFIYISIKRERGGLKCKVW